MHSPGPQIAARRSDRFGRRQSISKQAGTYDRVTQRSKQAAAPPCTPGRLINRIHKPTNTPAQGCVHPRILLQPLAFPLRSRRFSCRSQAAGAGGHHHHQSTTARLAGEMRFRLAEADKVAARAYDSGGTVALWAQRLANRTLA